MSMNVLGDYCGFKQDGLTFYLLYIDLCVSHNLNKVFVLNIFNNDV